MKKFYFIMILLLSFCCLISAQTDSIPVADRIAGMQPSKSDLISKGRRLLLDDLYAGNVEGAKEIMDYLTDKVEDENHMAFWASERLLLYYWIGDYSKILTWSLYLSSDTSIYKQIPDFSPTDDLIGKKINQLAIKDYDLITEDFKSLNYSKDTESFLSLFLDRLIVVYDPKFASLDKINESSDNFAKEYPQSPLVKVIKETVSYKFKPADWQWGMSFTGGTMFESGNISDYIDFDLGFFNMAFDAYYKKMYFGLNITGTFGEAIKDIPVKKNNRIWPNGENISITTFAPTIGFTALDYKRFKLTPFAGVSFNISEPSESEIDDNPELDGLSLGTSVSPLIGFNLDYSLTNMNKLKPKRYENEPSGCLLIGLKAMYMPSVITTQESRLTGSMYFVGLSFKVLFFSLKRIY